MDFNFVQAEPETVQKVCDIVKNQLALPEGSDVTGESKFSTLGADSLNTVYLYLSHLSQNYFARKLQICKI
jgi:hypothetical protein